MVNDSQALILFTCENPQGVLMFKLLLMRQTLFDFDVLLPWSCVAFLRKGPVRCFICG